MAALKHLGLAAALAFALPLPAAAIDRWRPQIAEASRRFDIPEAWIERVMRAESGGRTSLYGQPIRSPAGAIGLMQLMPATWAEMRQAHALGPNPDDPRDNILAGAAYLAAMRRQFGYPGLFAAYNAGPGRYREHLAVGRPLPRETVGYLGAVAPDARLASLPARPSLFVIARRAAAAATPLESRPAAGRLFVPLSGVPPTP